MASQDKDGLTPLHRAFLNGYLSLTQFLIKHGVAQDKDNESASLQLASVNGHVKLAHFRADHGTVLTVERVAFARARPRLPCCHRSHLRLAV